MEYCCSSELTRKYKCGSLKTSTNLNMKVPDSGQLLRSKEVRHCQEFRKRLFTR